MEAKALRSYAQWRNYPPGHDGGGARADAEVLLNAAGRQLLAGLCGVEEDVAARALPSWGRAGGPFRPGGPGRCRVGGEGGKECQGEPLEIDRRTEDADDLVHKPGVPPDRPAI